MTQTTTQVGRQKLLHPDLGYDVTDLGVALQAALALMWTTVSNDLSSVWTGSITLQASGSTTVTHNFGLNLVKLKVIMFESGVQLMEGTRDLSYTLAEVDTNSFTITNSTGGPRTFNALALAFNFLVDVDLITSAPADGEALVWSASGYKFIPGASGDASFKISSITDPNAVIKGGGILLSDGRELQTYDGAGTASTDFGKDLTISLDTVKGGDPVNATAYYLYIDLNLVGSAVTQTDTGRKVYPIIEGSFALSTSTPESVDKNRYIAIGVIISATSGTVWSGVGATFKTISMRYIDVPNQKFNRFVDGATALGGNSYATLTAAIAAASAGDRILVRQSYSRTSAETINVNGILIEFQSNVKITFTAGSQGLVISGNDVQLINPWIVADFTGTLSQGIEIDGDDCFVDRAKVEANDAAVTITDAFKLGANVDRAYINGLCKATAGTITNNITDSSTAENSDYRVRG